MKTITLGQLAQIIAGKLTVSHPHKQVRVINFGKPKYLEADQVYFVKKSIDLSKQLSAIRRVKPIAVVATSHFPSHLIPSSCGVIYVQDPYLAFWRTAIWNWKQHHPRVIGITGSAGKSSTTAMVSSILQHKYSMVKTQGNLNTFSFLPSYLARLKPHHRLLLLEMGMKSLNNIKNQCRVTRPDVGVVTNVGEAHVGSLGNLDIVVKAKQEMVDGVRPGGTLFLNADDIRSRKLRTHHFKGKIKRFGIQNPADIRAVKLRYSQKGMVFDAVVNGRKASFFLPAFGTHHVYNALAAIGVAAHMGATIPEIQKGLSSFRLPKMRMQFLSSRSGRVLINDAWNANPTAMIAGLSVLKNIAHQKPSVAVLGDMLELGNLSYQSHVRVGKYVASIHPTQLITIGSQAKIIAQAAIRAGMNPQRVFSYMSHDQVVRHITRQTPKDATVYFKASRKLHLEKVVQRLR